MKRINGSKKTDIATDLEGKSVVVTGGSKGIGRETARMFLQFGASVIITGRSENSLRVTLADLVKIGPPVVPVTADVSIEDDCRRVVNAAMENFGRIDILINNAGMSARGLFCDSEIDLYRTLLDINFLGSVMMSRLCIDELVRARGSIVFISSLAGIKGLPGLSHYSSSKMPLTAFSESIRGELKAQGVHVGIIYVGLTENDPDKTIFDSSGKRIPLKREKSSMSQQKVAAAVLDSVKRRRNLTTLTFLGKIGSFLNRLIPRPTEKLLARETLKSPLYKSQPEKD